MRELKFFTCEKCGTVLGSAEECADHERRCEEPGDVLMIRMNGEFIALLGPNREVTVKVESKEDLGAVRELLHVALRQVAAAERQGLLGDARRGNGKSVMPSGLADLLGGQTHLVRTDKGASTTRSSLMAELRDIHHILRILLERERAAEARYAEMMQPLRRTPSEVRSQGSAASEGPLPSPSCTTPGPAPSEE